MLSILTKILQVEKMIKAGQNKGLYYCKDRTIKYNKSVFQDTKTLILPCLLDALALHFKKVQIMSQ